MTSTALVPYRPAPPATTYQQRQLAIEVNDYLLFKRKRLTRKSERGYRAVLDDFADHFQRFTLSDFNPPNGGPAIEEFLEARWGHAAPRTYNKSFSIIHNFFDWELRRGRIGGDPMLALERAKARPIHRTTFNDQQCAAILVAATEPRERVGLRLLLDYGIRKGALQSIQLQHFDVDRRRVTLFTKGETIQELPIPDDALWDDLALVVGPGHHYLIPKQVQRRRRPPYQRDLLRLRALFDEAHTLADGAVADAPSSREALELVAAVDLAAGWLDRTVSSASVQVHRFHEEPIGEHGMHDLWYRWLARAGIVAKGVTRGERLHKARHTAGQRVLDVTQNLKAVQMLLGHRSIQTTGDHYTGWEVGQLADSLSQTLNERARKAETHV